MKKLICVALFALTLGMPAAEARSKGNLIGIASSYLGMNEHRQARQLKRILGVSPISNPWCGYFMAAVVRRAGHKPPEGYPSARRWVKFGKRSSGGPGTIAVMRSHVILVTHSYAGRVCGISGNSRGNSVSRSCYPRWRIIGFRSPS